ncbi:nucleotidyltransferase domain-containing protein [bacterium]|nr:nucleotidyltransferase domain-containing protein [bacterium]
MNDSIQHIVDKIVQQIHPEAIYLFGSRAKNDVNENADIDLLVIEKETFSTTKSRMKELSRIRKAIMPYSTPVDILLFSSDEVNEWKDSINHIIARCLREGKKIYG